MTKDKPSGASPKHTPKRTCIACRKTGEKREFIRLICRTEGNVEVDTTGKKSSRGAYLCPVWTCWENALNAGRLEFALRTSLKPDNKEKLVNYAKGFNNTSGLVRS
jgi:uncharacterized protein